MELSKKEAIPPTSASETKLCDFCQSDIPIKATRCRFCSATLAKTSKEEGEAFSVLREETKDKQGFVLKTVKIQLRDQILIQNVKSYLPSSQELFESEPTISADDLFAVLPQLRELCNNLQQNFRMGYSADKPSAIKQLVDFLEKEFKELNETFSKMLKENVITFQALQFYFQRGTKIYGYEKGYILGSEVTETMFQKTMFGMIFVIQCEVVKSNGDRFYSESHTFTVPHFSGVKEIPELPIHKMDEKTENFLIQRGETFAQVCVGAHYRSYAGKILWKTPFYSTAFRVDGRVMVDGTSFNKMNPTYREFVQDPNMSHHFGGFRGRVAYRHGQSEDSSQYKTIPKSALFKCYPTVGGFAFSIKKWGELIIENLMPVDWDDSAFDKLVLPLEKKKLMKALVTHSENSFSDIIKGKGAGTIFLLHGGPGTGKTLTAEAIAEMLHRPLYNLAVGDLGTKPTTLEENLRNLLEVSAVWNAVVLIDEADIFLEKRQDNDINRNAMVGIFLRLLEYHQGVLFLTTNRVHSFDLAFHSRISVALRYPDLDQQTRLSVWNNILGAAGINDIDTKKLSALEINGRQIRTSVRLAQSLASSESKAVCMEHFDRVLEISTEFLKDINSLNQSTNMIQ